MARKFLKRWLPTAERVREVKALRIFGERVFHPALWHLNRRTAAGGFAVGLFCGLIPGPLQMLGAGIAALVLRVNLPLALFTTLYTNPVTIVPLYLVAYEIGAFVLGAAAGREPAPPPTWIWTDIGESMRAYGEWAVSLGAPLALGVPLLAALLAALGYTVVRIGWNIYLRHAWSKRKRRRAAAPAE